MEPETGGDFIIYNYPAYIYSKLLKEFGKKYNVNVKVAPFDDINSGHRQARLRRRSRPTSPR